MRKKSPPIKYREEFPNPKFTKELKQAIKYELSVTMRLKNIKPAPNCNENKEDLIKRLREKELYKAVDLGGISNEKKLRFFLSVYKKINTMLKR